MPSPDLVSDCLFIAHAAAAVVGVAVLAFTIFHWKTVGEYVGEAWSKVVVELVQILAAMTSLGAAFAATGDKGVWFRPAVAAAICLSVWKLLQIALDNRAKAADKNVRSELERVHRQALDNMRLLAVVGIAVAQKLKRLRREVERRSAKPSIDQVRRALTPKPHLDDLLDALAKYFQAGLPPPEQPGSNFRVGVYVNNDGVMTPLHAVSLRDPGHRPFTSFDSHRDHFRLSNQDRPAHAVSCVRRKGMILVEDCPAGADRGEFNYYSEHQRSYLRSMVAYYLGEVCREDGTMTEAALVVDTNAAGYFKESEQDAVGYVLQEFGLRVKLELLLLALVARRPGAQ